MWQIHELLLTRAQVSLQPSAHRLLCALNEVRPASLGELAEGLAMTPPMASRIVRQLERERLVTRRAPSFDRRITLIDLTPAGEDVVERMTRAGITVLGEIVRSWSASDLATLDKLLAQWAKDIVRYTDGLLAERKATGDPPSHGHDTPRPDSF